MDAVGTADRPVPGRGWSSRAQGLSPGGAGTRPTGAQRLHLLTEQGPSSRPRCDTARARQSEPSTATVDTSPHLQPAPPPGDPVSLEASRPPHEPCAQEVCSTPRRPGGCSASRRSPRPATPPSSGLAHVCAAVMMHTSALKRSAAPRCVCTGVGAPDPLRTAGGASLEAGVEILTCVILTSLGSVVNGDEGRVEAFCAPLRRGDVYQTPEGPKSPPDSRRKRSAPPHRSLNVTSSTDSLQLTFEYTYFLTSGLVTSFIRHTVYLMYMIKKHFSLQL